MDSMCEIDKMDDEAFHAMFSGSDNLFTSLQHMMPYQEPSAHQELATLVKQAIDEPGRVYTVTLIGPHSSGKTVTTHALKTNLLDDQPHFVVVNMRSLVDKECLYDLMGTRQDRPRELSLAQRLTDASVGDPPLVMLIIDDLYLVPELTNSLDSLVKHGFLVTLNGSYFKLSPKTALLIVFTCKGDTPFVSQMGHLIVYQSPRRGLKSV